MTIAVSPEETARGSQDRVPPDGKNYSADKTGEEEKFRSYNLPQDDEKAGTAAGVPAGNTSSSQKSSAAGYNAAMESNQDSRVPLCMRLIDWSKRPEPSDGGPVQVRVECFFGNWEVRPVDGKERFFLTVKLTLWWTDERFMIGCKKAYEGEPISEVKQRYRKLSTTEITNADLPLDQVLGDHWPYETTPTNIWRPEIFSLYVLDVLKVPENYQEIPVTFMKPGKFGTDGLLQWQIAFEPLDMDMLRDSNALKVFPFDSFRCDFGICLSGETRLESAAQIRPTFHNEDKDGKEYHVHWRCALNNGEFYIHSMSYAEAIHGSPLIENQSYRDLIFSLHVARDPSFYLYKGLLPLLAITCFGFLGFFLETDALADRLALYSTMFLTCFAVQWITMDRLPRVAYLTVFDDIVLGVGAALFFMSCGAGVAKMLQRKWNRGNGENNGIAHPDDFDFAFGVALGVVFVLYVIYCLGYKVKRDRKKYGMSRKLGFESLFTIQEAYRKSFEQEQKAGGSQQKYEEGFIIGERMPAEKF
ncbi:unnamed protein product [Amoebophrya sp. A120]|nr:unnamed protein product [Amoebophrya sp. A120]|eukprot:GSA120T00004322001.1